MVSPRLVHVVGGRLQPRPVAEKLDFSDDALTKVRAGMDKVMNEPGGTAFAWRISEPGMEMAGKTGTAQVRRISMAERSTGVLNRAPVSSTTTSWPWSCNQEIIA